MIIRRYEVFFRDSMGEVRIGRYFRRQRALDEVRELVDNYRVPAQFRDRRVAPRRARAFVNGH